MTVYDFCNLCTDDSHEICIYDMRVGDDVFKGTIDDAMYSDYSEYEVLSYDLDYGDVYMCLNIETDED